MNKCSKRDPQINTCLKATFNNLRPYLARGIPEIGIPPMEPLRIDQLALENNAGNIRIKGLFTKIVSSGASNFTVKEVRSDVSVSYSFNYFYLYFRLMINVLMINRNYEWI